jgi:triacylglycerol lipase
MATATLLRGVSMKKKNILSAAKLSLMTCALLSATSSYAHDPVILIPGMTGVPVDMNPMQSYLSSHGWPSSILFEWTDRSNMEQDLADAAKELSAEVNSVLAKTGASRVVLVSWSASTLTTRYYIKNLGGAAKVSQYIGFAGPHHGTTNNDCQYFMSCIEFASPTTPFLTALNAGTEVPGSPEVAYLTLRSDNDVNVVPSSSAALAGAENILYTGEQAPNHFTIVSNNAALADMVSFIMSHEVGGGKSPTTTTTTEILPRDQH